MKFIFKSKKDSWITFILWVVILLPIYFLVHETEISKTSIILVSLTSLFCLWILHGTYYTIEEKTLKYQTGPFYGKVDIMSIKKIYKTKSIISSAALSMDRICIRYEKYNEVFISPEKQEEFVRVLKKINPNILIEI